MSRLVKGDDDGDIQDCSALSQALLTQGVILAVRPGCLQWHLKLVRGVQPSLPRASMKHFSYQIMLVGWMDDEDDGEDGWGWMMMMGWDDGTYRAGRDIGQLSTSKAGDQQNEEKVNEPHFETRSIRWR